MIKITPDLLQDETGAEASRNSWLHKRGELYKSIIPHEFGGMPPECSSVKLILRAHNRIPGIPGSAFLRYEIRAAFDNGKDISITLSMWRPPGEGPFPVMLDGDGCWLYFNEDVIRKTVARGNIAASFDRTETAADNKDAYRDTGLYRLFPDAGFGVLSAWAWAYHRCIDALTSMQEVQKEAIAVTGHSRGGKTALLAGATDERIAMTNPNDSGIGGSGLNRLKAEGSETIDSFFGSGNIFWFGRDFAAHRYRDAELPYDQHYLHALTAPRLLLVTEAYEDPGANPPGSYAACNAARAVYNMLDAPDRIGWSVREGGHTHAPEDYDALLDFMDLHFHKREVQRNFQRELFPGLHKLLSAPT